MTNAKNSTVQILKYTYGFGVINALLKQLLYVEHILESENAAMAEICVQVT